MIVTQNTSVEKTGQDVILCDTLFGIIFFRKHFLLKMQVVKQKENKRQDEDVKTMCF